MDGVLITPLKRIATSRGDVLHGMKCGDPGFAGFGEAYFSTVNRGETKGWKQHTRMTLNLVVPVGRIRFVICAECKGVREFRDILLSPESDELYQRLTISPGLWMAFRGEGNTTNMLLNVASIHHDPAEARNSPLESIPWNWPSLNG
ncbi:MAG: dTDP-4-dehydrorhamnose 3,5-epimerase [Alphaproteobacteria bacterium]|nr:dTDP-4-dehydrorhamnose 3,5-epimerase [Alphaproteobacteria bacterium]MDE2493456.1 dTDP-4-dehydrorhamnose 3,5-epimerase [Alphaproteobacteria bacterium]